MQYVDADDSVCFTAVCVCGVCLPLSLSLSLSFFLSCAPFPSDYLFLVPDVAQAVFGWWYDTMHFFFTTRQKAAFFSPLSTRVQPKGNKPNNFSVEETIWVMATA
mmetsp:Transcript_3409/g.6560  ORF Transcript_3409/g.6560 Transcript_3409/m.6560 type:complete len:105 (+) Transcript_3409:1731-2045(+)